MSQDEWSPNAEVLGALEKLIYAASVGDKNATQELFVEKAAQFKKDPDFYKYVAYMFKSSNNQKLRSIAGIIIKNGISSETQVLTPDTYEYVRRIVHQNLADEDNSVRNVAGNIITTAITLEYEPLSREVETLLRCLDSSDGRTAEGAFNALCKICEDSANSIEMDNNGLSLKTITKLLQILRNSNSEIRCKSLNSINNFVMVSSSCIFDNMDEFLGAIFSLMTEESPAVKKTLCQTILLILEINSDKLLPKISLVLEFMCHCLYSDDEDLSIEACEFWLSFVERDTFHDYVEMCLPQLVGALVNKMVYSEDFIANYESINYDCNEEDYEKDIKPRHYHNKTRDANTSNSTKPSNPIGITAIDLSSDIGEARDDRYFDEDDEDDIFSDWNIRKCASATLDVLSTIYGNDLLTYLQPHIINKLTHPDWLQQECGILILGAIAEGCASGLYSDYSNLLPFLLSSLKHNHPLVRSISCWTLSKYTIWTVYPMDILFGRTEPSTKEELTQYWKTYFEPILFGILEVALDNNKHVQESACSALAGVIESSRDSIIPYLDQIIFTFDNAIMKYKTKSAAVMYETLGTLADSVGGALKDPNYIQIIMKIVYQGLNCLDENTAKAFPLLECISSISMALGRDFQNYATDIWNKCLEILEKMFSYCDLEGTDAEVNIPYRDYISVCLDLSGNICQAIGPAAVDLIANSQKSIINYLQLALAETSGKLRQSAFALVGDIAATAYIHLKHYINNIMEKIISQIQNTVILHAPTANNAIWATGEIALKSQKEEFGPWIDIISQQLIRLLGNSNFVDTARWNSVITLSRMSLIYPYEMSRYFPEFIETWCSVFPEIEEKFERITAFEGLCKVAGINQLGIIDYLRKVSEIVVSWEDMPDNLKDIYKDLLSSYKGELGNSLNKEMSTWPEKLTKGLCEKCSF